MGMDALPAQDLPAVPPSEPGDGVEDSLAAETGPAWRMPVLAATFALGCAALTAAVLFGVSQLTGSDEQASVPSEVTTAVSGPAPTPAGVTLQVDAVLPGDAMVLEREPKRCDDSPEQPSCEVAQYVRPLVPQQVRVDDARGALQSAGWTLAAEEQFDGPGDDGAIRLLAYRDDYELTWWLRPDNHAQGCLDDSLDLVYCADSVFVLRVG